MGSLYSEQLKQLAASSDRYLTYVNDQTLKHNPFCGDRVSLQIWRDTIRIKQVGYQIKGCLVCRASTVYMAQLVEGLAIDEALALGLVLKEILTDTKPMIDRFRLFQPAMIHSARHSCVLLPYQALDQAIRQGLGSKITSPG